MITVDATGLRDAVRQRYVEVMDDAFQALLVDLEETAPRDTGAMAEAITLSASDDGDTLLTRTIVSPAEYSSFVDEGTAPHRIEGNPLLSFVGRDGTRVTVHFVDHPGTQRTGFWTDKVNDLQSYLLAAMG